ncbi:NUDIX hydrolase domain-containing protein [Geranomyces variabilis]|nr:NUDIX hydrolase domain-containing protein [Geranomyces variabilis]
MVCLNQFVRRSSSAAAAASAISSNLSKLPKPLRYAASAIVCAPVNAKEFKVLMLKRNSRGTFGSLHVFPGGMVDAVDSSPEWQTEQEKAASLNLSYFIAAIRETFEESGVLLTQPAPQMSSADLHAWRKKVHSDPRLFIEFCKAANIRPDVQGLIHWSNWITPPVEVSRFDTHFFLTVLNESHADTQCDGVETLELEWLTPQQAVDAFERGILYTPRALSSRNV